MNILKKLLSTLVIVVGVIFIAALLMPSRFTVERETLIKSEVAPVFEQVNRIENNEKWSAWKQLDPGMVITAGNINEGQGASYSWKGEKTGSGALVMTNSIANERIDTEMTFEGEKEKAHGYWLFKKVSDGTLVTQGFKARTDSLLGRLQSIFIKMFLSKQFSKELTNIKNIVEKKE